MNLGCRENLRPLYLKCKKRLLELATMPKLHVGYRHLCLDMVSASVI